MLRVFFLSILCYLWMLPTVLVAQEDVPIPTKQEVAQVADNAQARAAQADNNSTTAVWLAVVAMLGSAIGVIAGVFKDRDKLKYDQKLSKLEDKVEQCEEDRSEMRRDLDACRENDKRITALEQLASQENKKPPPDPDVKP